jgi:hypothetical protein
MPCAQYEKHIGLLFGRTDGNPQTEVCATGTPRVRYRQPQVLGVQPHPPEAEGAPEEVAPFEDLPALNTESCSVCRLLAHFGHSISWRVDITIRS